MRDKIMIIIDRYQIAEARLAGADCVLLIAECLDDAQLQDLYGYSQSLGMDALIELFDLENVPRVLATGTKERGDIVGQFARGRFRDAFVALHPPTRREADAHAKEQDRHKQRNGKPTHISPHRKTSLKNHTQLTRELLEMRGELGRIAELVQ